ncbi:hypothetical protein B0H14DRAFT_3629237 [Mycena olivaceomarginata]|nr:hypothetical protein B0H14DRAFT_3629237 [Mycena olivaceomarginata]
MRFFLMLVSASGARGFREPGAEAPRSASIGTGLVRAEMQIGVAAGRRNVSSKAPGDAATRDWAKSAWEGGAITALGSSLPSDRARQCHASPRTPRQRASWLVHGDILHHPLGISRAGGAFRPPTLGLVIGAWTQSTGWNASAWTSEREALHVVEGSGPRRGAGIPVRKRRPMPGANPLAAHPSALACAGRVHARSDSAVRARRCGAMCMICDEYETKSMRLDVVKGKRPVVAHRSRSIGSGFARGYRWMQDGCSRRIPSRAQVHTITYRAPQGLRWWERAMGLSSAGVLTLAPPARRTRTSSVCSQTRGGAVRYDAAWDEFGGAGDADGRDAHGIPTLNAPPHDQAVRKWARNECGESCGAAPGRHARRARRRVRKSSAPALNAAGWYTAYASSVAENVYRERSTASRPALHHYRYYPARTNVCTPPGHCVHRRGVRGRCMEVLKGHGSHPMQEKVAMQTYINSSHYQEKTLVYLALPGATRDPGSTP